MEHRDLATFLAKRKEKSDEQQDGDEDPFDQQLDRLGKERLWMPPATFSPAPSLLPTPASETPNCTASSSTTNDDIASGRTAKRGA